MLPALRGTRRKPSDEEQDDEEDDDEIDRAYELGLVDEEGNILTAQQAKVKQCHEELDRQCEILQNLIQNDKNYQFVKLFEDDANGSGGKGFGVVGFLKRQIDDFLVPPATRPEYEREQREMAKERAMKLDLEKRKKDFLLNEEESNKKSEKKKEAANMKGRLRSLDAPQVRFTRDIINANPSRGPLAAVPNLDYNSNQTPFLNYDGGRFQGTPHGIGIQKFGDGAVYEGEWYSGYQEGYGRMCFASKDEYCGQWHLGLEEGLGIFRSSNDFSYTGHWKHGKKNGYGEYSHNRKGTIFGGEFRDGKKNGFGIKAWLRTGTAFMGEWIEDKKHGGGLLRSDSASLGIGRFYTKWEKGNLLLREKYDPLIHGTEVLNSATWAAHYAAKAAIEAALVVEHKIGYPNAPHPVEREKHLTEQNDKEIPEHLQRFRDTWLTKRSKKKSDRRPSTNEPGPEFQQSIDHIAPEKFRVSARALRRLIGLVHSSDSNVEALVLPILNDAVELKDCSPDEEAFMVGPIWTQNMAKLENYFAAKIQRKWKSLAWKRAFKGARKAMDKTKQLELESQRLKSKELESQLVESRKIERQTLEDQINSQCLSTKLSRLVDSYDDNPSIIHLVKRSRVLFGQEMKIMPQAETNDRWTLPRTDTSKKSAPVSSAVSDVMKKKAEAGFARNDDDDLSDSEVELGMQMGADGIIYYGQVARQIPHGFGTATYPDGSTYSGQFSHGKRNGIGEYTIEIDLQDRIVKCIYVGEWKKNMRHGFAVEQSKVPGVFEQLLASTRTEYKEDEMVHSEAVDEISCAEWIKECDIAILWAKRAALEAHEMFDTKKADKTQDEVFAGMAMSKLILFSLDEGFSCYSGTFDAELGRHGSAVQEWDNGRRYAGEWVNDIPEGCGREDYADGSSYTGEFRSGKRQGYGRFVLAHGSTQTVYLGEWADGHRNGRGVERQEVVGGAVPHEVQWVAAVEYQDDVVTKLESFNHVRMRDFVDVAEQAVRNAARSVVAHQIASMLCIHLFAWNRAAGKAYPATRVEYPAEKDNLALWYVGGHLDGLRSGSGVLMMRDGTRYVGDFLHDHADGYGVETYPDGSVYTGQFKNAHRHGFGKYVTKRGMMHLGEWSKGLRQGRALQRSLVQLASGSISREYFVEFADDEERDRRLVKNRNEPWIKQADAAVRRAEETQALTVGIYQDLLD